MLPNLNCDLPIFNFYRLGRVLARQPLGRPGSIYFKRQTYHIHVALVTTNPLHLIRLKSTQPFKKYFNKTANGQKTWPVCILVHSQGAAAESPGHAVNSRPPGSAMSRTLTLLSDLATRGARIYAGRFVHRVCWLVHAIRRPQHLQMLVARHNILRG